MRNPYLAFLIILLIVGTLPAELPKIRPELPKVPPLLDTGRVVVRVEKTRKSWRLLRGGRQYFIKGACVWGEKVRVEELKGGRREFNAHLYVEVREMDARPGTSARTVMLGFEASKERHGFLYTDPKDVKAQREKFRKFVLAYKDPPALLIWGIGNEVEQGIADPVHRERMWRELNYLALMAKKLDPNHPTSIILAGATKEKITDMRRFCPDVDIISINTYGRLRNHPEALNKWAWDKPYIIAEHGAYGWWEAKMTAWNAPIEQTSTEKAKEYLISYQGGIVRDRNRCLGSYVFFWDSKQEATATWFGMFLPSGERLEMVDAMTRAWSDQRPHNGSPQLKELKFAGEQTFSSRARRCVFSWMPVTRTKTHSAYSGRSWRKARHSPSRTPTDPSRRPFRKISSRRSATARNSPCPKNPARIACLCSSTTAREMPQPGISAFIRECPAAARPIPTVGICRRSCAPARRAGRAVSKTSAEIPQTLSAT